MVMSVKEKLERHEKGKFQVDFPQATSICLEGRHEPLMLSAVSCPAPKHNMTVGKQLLPASLVLPETYTWPEKTLKPNILGGTYVLTIQR